MFLIINQIATNDYWHWICSKSLQTKCLDIGYINVLCNLLTWRFSSFTSSTIVFSLPLLRMLPYSSLALHSVPNRYLCASVRTLCSLPSGTYRLVYLCTLNRDFFWYSFCTSRKVERFPASVPWILLVILGLVCIFIAHFRPHQPPYTLVGPLSGLTTSELVQHLPDIPSFWKYLYGCSQSEDGSCYSHIMIKARSRTFFDSTRLAIERDTSHAQT